MENVLGSWLKIERADLEARGFTVARLKQHGYLAGACSVEIDSPSFVGGICFWPPKQFEFHFIDSSTGEDIILESPECSSVDEVAEYFDELVRRLNGALQGTSMSVTAADSDK